MKRRTIVLTSLIAFLAVGGFFFYGCTGSKKKAFDPAKESYVPVGEWDKHYAFISGGQNGSIFVYGIPSGRMIRTIPIFEPEGSYGYAIKPGSPSWE
ncbi:MAG: hypothetical protein ABEK50_06055, partial [bacterium]